jgi:hypothetical protein
MEQFIGTAGFSLDYKRELFGIFPALPDLFRISIKYIDISGMPLRTCLKIFGITSSNESVGKVFCRKYVGSK